MGYHYGPYMAPLLMTDGYAVSEAAQTIINLSLDAPSSLGGTMYWIFGSGSGTSPGINLPGGSNLPINFDIFTALCIEFVNTTSFINFMGNLDTNGDAVAIFDTQGPLPPGAVGISLHFAFTVKKFALASNAVMLTVVP